MNGKTILLIVIAIFYASVFFVVGWATTGILMSILALGLTITTALVETEEENNQSSI